MNDLISRTDAIEAVRKLIEEPRQYYTQYNNGIEHSVKALSALPSAEAVQGEWIPCSERLPKARESVILSTKEWTGEGCYWETTKYHVIWKGYRWNATYWDDEVIAWMPLTKPYREDGEA